eukprot:gnl/MRDRNA2_/MRDRNA2_189039_c0_seq1.p1 gnl/MRDRNA2_/MRDRNA2_189039_c0~~gnl/MRDRNA2_/MRDRNA2_189039_c0_seq1.p1  ORF type:complete len:384 (+),score=58.50 gnl/MRDRNA2_/MRDRNA2_189039_c0_seq1:147-1154(+)
MPYLCAMMLDLLPRSQLQFRALFALGALPSMMIFLLSFGLHDSVEFKDVQNGADKERSFWQVLSEQDVPVRRMLWGTSLTWFAFDVAYYGTFTFVPNFIIDIFGNGATASKSLAVLTLSFPGKLLAIALWHKLGPRGLNISGFIAQAVVFALLGCTFELMESVAAKFILLCILANSLTYGPNLATYVAPAIYFPPEVRSTFHGFSAFSGKVGAVVGTFLFEPMHEAWGITSVLWLQCVTCLFAAFISCVLLPHGFSMISSQDARKKEQMHDSDSFALASNMILGKPALSDDTENPLDTAAKPKAEMGAKASKRDKDEKENDKIKLLSLEQENTAI